MKIKPNGRLTPEEARFSHQKPAFSLLAVFLLAVFLLAVFQQKSNSFDFSFFSARSHSAVKSLAVLQLNQLKPRIYMRR